MTSWREMNESMNVLGFDNVAEQVRKYIESLFKKSVDSKKPIYYLPTNKIITNELPDEIKHCKKKELLQEIVYLTAIMFEARVIEASKIHDNVLGYIKILKEVVLANVSVFNAQTFERFPYFKSEASVNMIKHFLHVVADTYTHRVSSDVTQFLKDLYKSNMVWRVFFPNLFETELQHNNNVIKELVPFFKGPRGVVDAGELRTAMISAEGIIGKTHPLPSPKFDNWVKCDPFDIRMDTVDLFRKLIERNNRRGLSALLHLRMDDASEGISQPVHVSSKHTTPYRAVTKLHEIHPQGGIVDKSTEEPRHAFNTRSLNALEDDYVETKPISNRNPWHPGWSAWGENGSNSQPPLVNVVVDQGPSNNLGDWAKKANHHHSHASTSSDISEQDVSEEETRGLYKEQYRVISPKFRAPK